MKRIYLLTVVSAILSALPFTFPSLFILAIVAPSIFFYFLFKCEGKAATRLSFIWPITYHLTIHYYFLSLYPLDFAGLSNVASVAVVLLGWVGISLFQGALLGLFFYLYKKIFKFNSAIIIAALFAICEFVQSLGFVGFPWGQLSLTQWSFLPFIQSLSLFGPYFLTFLLVLINGLIARFALCKKKKYLIVAAALFVTNLTFGAVRMSLNSAPSPELSVAVVQPSITTGEKWDTTLGRNCFDVHMSLSETVKDSDIIVWSETAVPSHLLTQPHRLNQIYDFMSKNNNDFIIGAFYSENSNTYNSAIYFDNQNTHLYHKRHLVPFGEYVPGRAFFEAVLPFVTEINMLSSDLTPGKDAAVFDTPHGKIGALVCFDSIFTNLAQKSAKDGAELMVVITNDSWYKNSRALVHHNAQAIFRAVENNRYVVRCANTGISSFIDNYGRVISDTLPYEVGAYQDTVCMVSDKTLYTTTGNVAIPIFVLLIPIIYFYKKHKRL